MDTAARSSAVKRPVTTTSTADNNETGSSAPPGKRIRKVFRQLNPNARPAPPQHDVEIQPEDLDLPVHVPRNGNPIPRNVTPAINACANNNPDTPPNMRYNQQVLREDGPEIQLKARFFYGVGQGGAEIAAGVARDASRDTECLEFYRTKAPFVRGSKKWGKKPTRRQDQNDATRKRKVDIRLEWPEDSTLFRGVTFRYTDEDRVVKNLLMEPNDFYSTFHKGTAEKWVEICLGKMQYWVDKNSTRYK